MALASSSAAADYSLHALDGFFTHVAAPSPSLFLNFQLATNSWEELERKRALAESTSDTHVKIVYLVRHAEGIHNVAERELGTERWEAVEAKQDQFLDADLTPFGVRDTESKGPVGVAAELAKGMPKVGRVVVSPLSRAIQTAQHFFKPDQAPRPFLALELARETLGVHTCDKRRTTTELTAKFAEVDFTRIQSEQDPWWTPTHRETDDELQVRARAFLVQLVHQVSESHVAVVTHSGFISAVWSLFHHEPFHAANCEVVPLALAWTRAASTPHTRSVVMDVA